MTYAQLVEVSRAALKNSIQLKPNEKVLIVSNPGYDVEEIARSLYEAVDVMSGIPLLIYQRKKGQLDLAELPAIEALKWADVVLSISQDKYGKDPTIGKEGIKVGDLILYHHFRYLMESKKIRSAWTPEITKKIYLQCVDVDYNEMSRYSDRIVKRLEGSNKIRVTSPNGTDITFSVKGRKFNVEDGLYNEPGKGGNWPTGEVEVAPSLGTSNGTIVFSGSLSVLGKTLWTRDDRVKVEVKDGYVTRISGGEAARTLENDINRAMQNAREKGRDEEYIKASNLLGEWAIGTNLKARIQKNMLSDEKVRGTSHFAIGSNVIVGGEVEAENHFDGVIMYPTIMYDNFILMKHGKLTD